MACTLVNISQDACERKGGIVEAYLLNAADINLATTVFTGRTITTWNISGDDAIEIEFDGKQGNYTDDWTYDTGLATQTIPLVVKGKSAAQIAALNSLKECCNLVLVVKHATDANYRVFGLDVKASALTDKILTPLRVDIINDGSGTLADMMSTTVTFKAESLNLALFATAAPPVQ
jgi:hypothetical protein